VGQKKLRNTSNFHHLPYSSNNYTSLPPTPVSCYTKSMKTPNYEYQTKAAKAVLGMALSNKFEAAVLAGTAGCGKSTIIKHVLNDLLKSFRNATVVLLTHNQNYLKQQMIDDFSNNTVPAIFTSGFLGSNAEVQVGIPAHVSRTKEIDLL